MRELRIEGPDAVTAVLAWAGAVPPVVGGDGACLALRASMARFSGSAEHPARRSDVEAAAAGVDVATLAAATSAAVRAHLGGRELDAVAVGRAVPVAALAAALGLAGVDPADVERVAAVIGRGAPTNPDADAAAERLLAVASGAPHGPVATVSLLYQSLDATAALLLTTLHARAAAAPRVAAVPRTRRVAVVAGAPGGVDVQPGDDLVVEIGAAGLEFGAGPHACPGRGLAELIVASIVDELDTAGYVVDAGSIDVDPDGRPVAMTMRRR